jgi:ferredoxin-type protein NapF
VSILPKRSGRRLAVLVALFVAALFLPPVILRYALPTLSPFLWFCTLLATQTFGIAFLLGLPMLIFVILRRRGFCHHFCPLGWTVELCAKARPHAQHTYTRVPKLGQWAALLSVGGVLASVPFLLLLDPVGIVAGMVGATQTRLVYAALFGLVTVLSFAFPMLWCRKLCPLGATQDLIAAVKSAFVHRLSHGPAEEAAPNTTLARRAFLGVGGGVAVSALAVRSARETADNHLRPPGSVSGTELSALCVRCGNCVRACPTGIIQPDVAPAAMTALLVPTLRFDTDSCLQTCNECGQICPTGAIEALPLAEKNERKIGLARIETAGCLLAVEQECNACSLVCTRKAIVEEFSEETYTAMVHVDKARCNGCGACVSVCPPRVIKVGSAVPENGD